MDSMDRFPPQTMVLFEMGHPDGGGWDGKTNTEILAARE
jgi:hypothetical protein